MPIGSYLELREEMGSRDTNLGLIGVWIDVDVQSSWNKIVSESFHIN